jgi:hypothetical protein
MESLLMGVNVTHVLLPCRLTPQTFHRIVPLSMWGERPCHQNIIAKGHFKVVPRLLRRFSDAMGCDADAYESQRQGQRSF